ncbi:hypothetical protein CRG98_006614 [Punica granatum]|uniref:Uncharacterized protein n=1 Tax=Punica granatum TaxID=22663 RepID=A0A2I0KX06_PUNGR|nr:hypothetical protein CRG98_006614 [Punica granatum]
MTMMHVLYEEEYIQNSRGVKLFTCRWLPSSTSKSSSSSSSPTSPRALVFICHGYGMECSGFMRGGPTSWVTREELMADVNERFDFGWLINHVTAGPKLS